MASTEKTIFHEPDTVEQIVLRKDITYEESQKLYTTWADVGTYDDIHGQRRRIYHATFMFLETVKSLFPDVSKVRVLDAGAGTGLTGEQLHNVGYTNVDALEPQPKFAEECRRRGYYQEIFIQDIGRDTPVPVPNDTYDAVCIVGSFGPGAIPPSAFHEFIRIIKPGGYIVNCMREEFIYEVPQYKDKLIPLLKDLEAKGQIRQLEWTVYPNHFQDTTGVRMIYQIC